MIPLATESEDQWINYPKNLILTQIYFLGGNLPMSKVCTDSPIIELNLRIKKVPDDDRYYAELVCLCF